MSNKNQLQTNNTKYASLIETLRGKAVGGGGENLDTELAEQTELISQLSTILDSKASGGSGGAALTFGQFSVTDCGTYEPGVNEYTLVSTDLHASTRCCILVYKLIDSAISGTQIISFIRSDTSAAFVILNDMYTTALASITTIEDDNTIRLYCNTSHMAEANILFIAF